MSGFWSYIYNYLCKMYNVNSLKNIFIFYLIIKEFPNVKHIFFFQMIFIIINCQFKQSFEKKYSKKNLSKRIGFKFH